MNSSIRLSKCVEVIENNSDCVVLKVKDDSFYELIGIIGFYGNEKLIRLTKGKQQICTIWNNNNCFSWEWGYNGHTIVSESMNKKGKIIEECIEYCLNIPVSYRHTIPEYFEKDKSKFFKSI